jgi:glutathione S-transferase
MAASLVIGVTRGCAWRFGIGMEEGKVAMTAFVESTPLKLYFHPFASFCQKALIAFYENHVPFEPIIVDLADAASRTAFEAVWPIARFPVLRDDARDRLVPESSVIIEYLDLYYPGPTRLVPDDANAALTTRMRDRFFDFYVSEPMQKIVTDRIRPAGKADPHGVEAANRLLQTAYVMLDREMATRTWAIGEMFTLADCAAAPALFYSNWVMPFGEYKNVAAYFSRLSERPSFAQVVEEAKPYRHLFPK